MAAAAIKMGRRPCSSRGTVRKTPARRREIREEGNDSAHVNRLEYFPDRPLRARQPNLASHLIHLARTADQRPDARAVDRSQARQIDHQLACAAVDETAHRTLGGLQQIAQVQSTRDLEYCDIRLHPMGFGLGDQDAPIVYQSARMYISSEAIAMLVTL